MKERSPCLLKIIKLVYQGRIQDHKKLFIPKANKFNFWTLIMHISKAAVLKQNIKNPFDWVNQWGSGYLYDIRWSRYTSTWLSNRLQECNNGWNVFVFRLSHPLICHPHWCIERNSNFQPFQFLRFHHNVPVFGLAWPWSMPSFVPRIGSKLFLCLGIECVRYTSIHISVSLALPT